MVLREIREKLDPRVLPDPKETPVLRVLLGILVRMVLMEHEDLLGTLVPRVITNCMIIWFTIKCLK